MKRSLIVVVVLALAGLRLVHLEADVPREVTTWSVGVFVDEGYKTLDARNQAQFGRAHWHPGDDYPGWREQSPLIHAAYVAAFETLGVRLGSARLVTVLCFAGLLAVFAFVQRGRYPPGLILLGLLLLGTGHLLFFFSRLALLEVPLALCLYAALLCTASDGNRARTALTFVALLALATFAIKRSAPLYFAPVGLGLVVAALVGRERRASAGPLVLAGAAILAVTLWLAISGRIPNLDATPHNLVGALVWSTWMRSSSALLALGLGCALHALVVDPRRYLEHPYRAGLLALVVLGPVAIGLFDYRPLRYFAPLLPAYALLAVEWLHLRTWQQPLPARTPRWALAPLLALAAWFSVCAGLALHRFALTPLLWPEARLTAPAWVLALSGVLVAALLLGPGRRLFAGRSALVAVTALMLAAGARDALVLGRFLAAPSREFEQVSAALAQHVGEGESVAGDWAPMLTLGTPIRTLYTNPRVNRPARFVELRPDYLLLAGNWQADRMLALTTPVRGGPPVYTGRYAGRRVELIPLTYPAEPNESDPVDAAER